MPHRHALALALVLAACSPKATTAPASGAASPAADAPVRLDGELVALVAKDGAIDRMKIRTDATGAIVKQSLYHHDDAAIPSAVRELATKTWPDAKIVSFETERYADRGRVYEVEVATATGQCELAATEDGTLVYQECRIDPATLAAPVAARVAELWPSGKIVEAETKRGPDVDEVTVEIEHGGKAYYLRAKPDGTVVQRLVRVPAIVEVPLP